MKVAIDGSVILVIIGIVLLGIIAYYVARFLKGKLTLELSSATVASKQPLSGTLTVHAKKNIHGMLIVALVGQVRKTVRKRKGNSSELVDVFRQETVLEEEREFPVGFTEQYQFTFVAPTSTEARSGQGVLRNVAEKVGGTWGAVMNVGANMVGEMQGRIEWHVEARLDAKGVDLYAEKNITVNLGN